MDQRIAIGFLTVAAPASLALFVLPVPLAGEIFALLAVAFPVAVIVVGASRDGGVGPLRAVLIALTLILEGALLAMLALRDTVEEGSWIGGLPLPAAVMIYVMFAVPLPLVGLAYALTFDRFTLREEDLERLDRRFGRRDGEA